MSQAASHGESAAAVVSRCGQGLALLVVLSSAPGSCPPRHGSLPWLSPVILADCWRDVAHVCCNGALVCSMTSVSCMSQKVHGSVG